MLHVSKVFDILKRKQGANRSSRIGRTARESKAALYKENSGR